MDKPDNIESSSVKKNKIKNGSNSKIAEYRYADDNENEQPYINNVFPNVGVYEKVNRFNNNFYENKDKSFTDMIINQKLNFEVINENYQNGKFYIIKNFSVKNIFIPYHILLNPTLN